MVKPNHITLHKVKIGNIFNRVRVLAQTQDPTQVNHLTYSEAHHPQRARGSLDRVQVEVRLQRLRTRWRFRLTISITG